MPSRRGDRTPEPGFQPQFGPDHRRASDGHAHALQRRPNDRTLHRCRQDGVNPGKKSPKVVQDCTICRSCREAVIGPVVLGQRAKPGRIAGT